MSWCVLKRIDSLIVSSSTVMGFEYRQKATRGGIVNLSGSCLPDFSAILFLSLAMQNARIGDQMSSEPRPSAKQAAMKGVEVEQITVPKNKPGTAPKPRGIGLLLSHVLYCNPVC